MEFGKYLNYSIEEFILDQEFADWVLNPDREKDLYWKSFLKEYPEKRSIISDASLIVRSLRPIQPDVSQEQLDKILQHVKNTDKIKVLNGLKWLKYAAGIALLITAGSLFWLSHPRQNPFSDETPNEPVLKGKIILANGSTKEFDTDQTTIKQTSSGKLTINNDTIDIQSNKETSAMNQIIIPYGKRSEITLADGTHIWLNSGSKLCYPSEFKADSREVSLSGEAFFEVKSNPKKPFYVYTKDIRIKVLGTSFNVSSYKEDNTLQTVLLHGKVSAGKNKLFAKTIDLVPGERMIYDKSRDNFSKDKVDVNLYASWVNGYLIFDNIPITEVYKKLKRYYNQDIVAGEGLETITFSGKLDLKENLKDVLENISFASSVKTLENNGVYIIKK